METLSIKLPFNTRLTFSEDETMHMHEFYECFYVKEGSIYHEIDGRIDLLGTGDAFIVAPYVAHNFKRIDGQDCSHRDCMISAEVFEKCCKLIDEDILKRLKTERFIKYRFSQSDMQNFEDNVSAYIISQNAEKMLKYDNCLVVALLSHAIIVGDDAPCPDNEFMMKCNAVLSNCFTSFNAVDEVYDAFGYNKSYMSKKFKENYGVTLTEKINELKIKYSDYLLSATDYTIAAICDKIGIESAPYFFKLFKKYYGATPHRRKAQLGATSIDK